MNVFLTTALAGALLLLSSSKAHALYNGSLGTAPSAQGWLNNFSGGQTQTVGSSGTTLDTTGNDGVVAGYGRFATLNRNTGYNLIFRLRVLSENHDNVNAQNNTGTDSLADRAGLSIAVLSSTDALGIELGFWTDRVWAQEDGAVKADPLSAPTGTRFTQAEGAAFDTQSAVNQYDLSILGTTYYFYVNGNYATPLLSGRLRNYTAEGSPYNVPGTIAMGDNTTSARGSFFLEQVALTNSPILPTAVPFAFNPILSVGLFAVSRIRKAVFAKKK